MRRVQLAGGIALAGPIFAALLASTSAAAVDRMSSCPGGKIRTASGCTSPAPAGRESGRSWSARSRTTACARPAPESTWAIVCSSVSRRASRWPACPRTFGCISG